MESKHITVDFLHQSRTVFQCIVAIVLDKGTFIIGLDDSFPPLGYRDENNDIVGFDIDVARAVAEKLGVEFIAQPISWEAKELELSSGNIDCIWNGMSITPEREESMAMTFPYLNNQIVCYVKDDSDITSLADLAGKSVAVQNGSYAEELLLSDAYADAKASFADMPGFEDYLTALMDLQQGGVDAVIMDLVVGDYRINSMGAENLKAAFPLEDDNYGIGFRKLFQRMCSKGAQYNTKRSKDGGVLNKSFRHISV